MQKKRKNDNVFLFLVLIIWRYGKKFVILHADLVPNGFYNRAV
jgi:hypothetical protein